MTPKGRAFLLKRIALATTLHELQAIWDGMNPAYKKDPAISAAKDKQKEELTQ